MGVDEALDITAEERKTVLSLLGQHLPGTAAWVYGSRAKWTSRSQSDLDLVVFPTPKQRERVGDLREAFEESNLPFRVDLFVWDEVPDTFREQIHADHITLVEGPEKDSAIAGSSRCSSHGWTKRRLVDLCDISRGASPRPIHSWIANHGTPWVKIADATASASRYIEQTRECILREGQSKSVTVFPGDLILSNSASPGIPRFMKIEACIHDGWLLLRNFRGLDRLFTYYLLLYERSTLVGKGTGSVFTNLKTETLKQHEVSVPNLGEQRAIAHVLGTLDDKIELNRRMNEMLEAMARAIFKDWFVDFGPTRAKAEGRTPYLAAELWDLFPDALDDEDKPVGWELSEIGKEVEAVGGATPSTKEPSYWNGGENHWATPKDLSKLASPVLLDTDRKITDAAVNKISSGLLPVGTVLLSSRAPIGYLAIAEVPTAVNQGFIAMVCRKRLPNVFVLFWSYENLDYIKGISGGSTFAEISKKAFRPVPVVVPSERILTAYESLIRPLYERIVTNTKESASLAQTRDLLLPRLMSGEIRLREAEKAVEAVV